MKTQFALAGAAALMLGGVAIAQTATTQTQTWDAQPAATGQMGTTTANQPMAADTTMTRTDTTWRAGERG